MTRFVISSDQAVELVYKSIKYGKGGDIFVPKLPAFSIVDLIEILKQKHNANNPVKIVGIRPGEKIHELMINSSEVRRTYDFRDIYIITSMLDSNISLSEREYVQGGKLLKEEEMSYYCSNDTLLSQQEIKALFQKLGLISKSESNGKTMFH